MAEAEMGGAPVGERRPIKTREKNWARRAALLLVRWRMTPNAISVAGMVAGILAGGFLARTGFGTELNRLWWLLGAGCVQLRLLANMLDGMVAVESGQTSKVGDLYNEIPDRVSDVAIIAGLGWAQGGNPLLGVSVACLAVFVAYVRAMGKAAGAQNEFCGPFAKPQRMFFVTVTALFYGCTPAAVQGLGGRGVSEWMLWLIGAGCVVTAVRRLLKIAATLRGDSHE